MVWVSVSSNTYLNVIIFVSESNFCYNQNVYVKKKKGKIYVFMGFFFWFFREDPGWPARETGVVVV